MVRQKLNPKIFSRLKKKFPKKTNNALNVKLSKISRKHNTTLNAAAEIWGRQENFSVWGLLDKEDKESLKDKSFQTIVIKRKDNVKSKNRSVVEFIKYQTQDNLLKAHIDEINRCYSHNCYTATFILIRKVIENLIKEIIKKRLSNKSLYLDLGRGRIHDLSILIKNLKQESNSFGPEEKKLVQRILFLSEKFKDDANDKAHSLCHISTKREIEDIQPQMIFDVIEKYFTEY